jgi:hypothetical protein
MKRRREGFTISDEIDPGRVGLKKENPDPDADRGLKLMPAW